MIKKKFKFVFWPLLKIIKYPSVLKNSFVTLKKILPLVKSNKLKFILETIKSQNFVKFQPNLDNEKMYFKNKYKFQGILFLSKSLHNFSKDSYF